jgi:lipopolysaccharide/colanic/teichoic acid biosynthesis glycosyltransferase
LISPPDTTEAESYTQTVEQNRDKWLYYRVKRVLDILIAGMLLLLLSPFLLVIALLIKLDSPGPVIYRQERVGYDWRHRTQRKFTFYKFRSMYHNCDQTLHKEHIKAWVKGKVNGNEDPESGVKISNDPRITRVGHYLRRTSVDELPQLWNVLEGSMSLVGPRPVPTYEVIEYENWHYARLEAPAGMTGLWQVKARGKSSLDEMARLDIDYIQNQSILYDFEILFSTIPVVLSRRGAK